MLSSEARQAYALHTVDQAVRASHLVIDQVEEDRVLKEGDKILIAHRRLFEKDEPRFFVGFVEAYECGIVKSTGYSYVRDPMNGQLIKKAERRTKLVSLSAGTVIVYLLPEEVLFDSVWFTTEAGHMTLTDGKQFTMNLTEFTHSGRV